MRLEEFETASHRVEELRNLARSAREKENALHADLEKARHICQQSKLLDEQKQKLQYQLNSAEENHSALNRQIKSIEQTENELKTLKPQLEKLTSAIPELEKQLQLAAAQAAGAQTEVNSVRGRRRKIRPTHCWRKRSSHNGSRICFA